MFESACYKRGRVVSDVVGLRLQFAPGFGRRIGGAGLERDRSPPTNLRAPRHTLRRWTLASIRSELEPTGCLQQHIHPVHVGLDKAARLFDRPVYVRFGGEVDYGVDPYVSTVSSTFSASAISPRTNV